MREILRKREVLFALTRAELATRYALPALGFFWAFLSPFLTSVIFFIVFSRILKVYCDEGPFFLYLMTALFPWHFFHESAVSSAASLLGGKNVIKESRFAQYLIPVSIVLANAVTFLPALLVIAVVSSVLLKGLPIFIVLLPLAVGIHIALTAGLAILCAVLYVRWRDVKYVLEIVLMLLFYLTPVFYSVKLVVASLPPFLAGIYFYNPFVSILTMYRYCLIRGYVCPEDGGLFFAVLWSAFCALVALCGACFVYIKNKDSINDYLSY